MKAMVLERPGRPLRLVEQPAPAAGAGQILVEVGACGACRTDLHIVDGDLATPRLPVIPGHEIIGRVRALGHGVTGFAAGDRVGVPWLGSTCSTCWFCRHGQENLCDEPGFTGYQIDGGYADFCVADASYCFPVPPGLSDVEAAPLMCAGLIGYRVLRFACEAEALGIFGFGAAAHIVAQLARHRGQRVYAFTRPGARQAQEFALSLGCVWAGTSHEMPPEKLDAAIIFAPVGAVVPQALKATRKGGTVVLGGIHMSDIPSMSYDILWGARWPI